MSHFVLNLQFTTKKEGVEEKYEKLKKEHGTIETGLKNLRETYNNRQDTWIKEKLGMQVREVLRPQCKVVWSDGKRSTSFWKLLIVFWCSESEIFTY